MTYILKSNNKKDKKTLVVGIFIVIVIIFSLLKINPLSYVISTISYPMFKLGDFVSKPFDGFFGYLKSKKDLENDNNNLRLEIGRLESEMRILQVVADENKYLKESFGRSSDNTKGILGIILKRPPQSPYDTFIIDLGSDSISIDKTAYVNNVPIGKVVEVNNMTSIVKLHSSSGSKINILINNTEFEATGKGGGRFEVSVPRDFEVNIGNPIIVSSINNELLGVVESIDEGDINTLKIIRFNTPFSLQDVKFVEVK